MVPEAKCHDCGLDYSEFGLDMILPRYQWIAIFPEDDGLLCANCIVRRVSKIEGAVGISAVIEMWVPSLEDK